MTTVASLRKPQCTGCGACFQLCPANAIKMTEDSEGFLYPNVDNDTCTDCGDCIARCPSINPTFRNNPSPDCYAACASKDIRASSTSGGMFPLFAEEVLARKGAVCGAVLSKDCTTVSHSVAQDSTGVEAMRGTKYVQSDTRDTYSQIQTTLDTGKPVLFTGCPCQVAGLYAFLKKDYSDLFTVDLICHGVPSPAVFRSYADETARRQGSPLSQVHFREKQPYGWGGFSGLAFKDGTVQHFKGAENKWSASFSQGLAIRPSCGTCLYSNVPRVGDVTIGDFWGIADFDKSLDDKLGTSVVLVNSSAGERLLAAVRHKMAQLKKMPLAQAQKKNPQIRGRHYSPSPLRRLFINKWRSHGFHEALIAVEKRAYDVGVIGFWHAVNYGAILTGYALQRTVESMGYSCAEISPVPRTRKDLTSAPELPYRFAREYVPLFQAESDTTQLNDNFNTFVSASDQLWNGTLTKQNTVFFLPFAAENKKKIACATSFGDNYSWPDNYHTEISFYLHRYQFLSSRERKGVEILRDEFDLEATHLLDPVFFPPMEQYDELVPYQTPAADDKYLLVYLLEVSDDKQKAILDVSRRLNLRPIVLLSAHEDHHTAASAKLVDELRRNTPLSVQVEDYVHYFKKANFVMTDSFHGTCFSLRYNKKFISLELTPTKGKERAHSLLSLLQIRERLVAPADVIGNDYLLSPIDYESVNRILEQERQRSLTWLKTALDSPVMHRGPSAFDFLMPKLNKCNRQIAALNKEVEDLKALLASLPSSGSTPPPPSADTKKGVFSRLFHSKK